MANTSTIYRIQAYNGPATYAFGTLEEAEKYAEHLDGNRTQNLHCVTQAAEGEIEEYQLNETALVLEDELRAISDE